MPTSSFARFFTGGSERAPLSIVHGRPQPEVASAEEEEAAAPAAPPSPLPPKPPRPPTEEAEEEAEKAGSGLCIHLPHYMTFGLLAAVLVVLIAHARSRRTKK